MEQLTEDIRIILARDIESNSDRFSLNNGTRILSPDEANNFNYVQACFVPKQEWKTANSVEFEQLTTGRQSNWNLGSYIGIIKIPDYLLKPLRQIIEETDIDSSNPSEDIGKVSLHPDYQYAIQQISAHLQQYALIPNNEIKNLGIHCSKPKLVTTTVNALKYLPDKPYVGLHLDSWENAPLRRRHLSSNRICINIGQENRYFLLINLSLMKIFDLLGLSTVSDISQHYRGLTLPAEFMQHFPSYPVVKVALAPNEAYIAPTENMIHDASSLDKQKLDFSLTFLGKFGIIN